MELRPRFATIFGSLSGEPHIASIRLKEIARATGLSVPTVGNVLGRSGHRYSEQTRQRVMEAAARLGYRPNSSARAIRSGRFNCAALVLSRSRRQSHSHTPAGLIDGLDEELALLGMHLAVSRLSDEQLTSGEFLPKVLREFMADGMVLNYTHDIPTAMLDLIEQHHTPAVWVNNKLPHDCVHPDDLNAARDATAKLIELGHRRIAFVHLIATEYVQGSLEDFLAREHYSVADRIAGYQSAMKAAGLKPRVVGHDQPVPETEQARLCCAALAGGASERPTAVIVYSDHDLSLVMCAAQAAGLEVPRDLSVLVFLPAEPWVAGKHVSIVKIPTEDVGRRAVRMLKRKIENPLDRCAPDAVPFTALLGDTLAPPPAASGRNR